MPGVASNALLSIFVQNQLSSGVDLTPIFFENLRNIDSAETFQEGFTEEVMAAIVEYIELKSVIKAGVKLTLTEKATTTNAAVPGDSPAAISLSTDVDTVSTFATYDPKAISRAQLGAGLTAKSLSARDGAVDIKPNGTASFTTGNDAALKNGLIATDIMSTIGNTFSQVNPTGSIPNVRCNLEDLDFEILDSNDDPLEWVTNTWQSIHTGVAAAPLYMRFSALSLSDPRYVDLQGQTVDAGFGLNMGATNTQVLAALEALDAATTSSADDLYDRISGFSNNNFTLTQALQISSRDGTTTNINGSAYTAVAAKRFSKNNMVSVPAYSSGLGAADPKVRERFYTANTNSTNAFFAGIKSSVSRAAAVTEYADQPRENSPANYAGASPFATVVRSAPTASGEDLHRYLSFMYSDLSKEYFADVIEGVKSDMENSYSPAAVSSIDFQEIGTTGVWADAVAPTNIHVGAITVLRNRGVSAANKRAYLSSASTSDDVIDEISGLAGIAAYAPVALTATTFDFSALGSSDVFSDDNKIYQALAAIAAVKKTAVQTNDEYMLASLLTTSVTANTLPTGAAWNTPSDRDQVALRIMGLMKTSNTTASGAGTPLLDYNNASNLQLLVQKGLLTTKYDSATGHTNVYAYATSLQPASSPNHFEHPTTVGKVALAKKVLAALNIEVGSVNTRVIAANYTSDISPYGTAGDLTFPELTAVLAEVGSTQLKHVPIGAHVQNNVSARTKALKSAADALGATNPLKAQWTKSANLGAFFLGAAATWTDGTTPIDASRQLAIAAHDRVELKQMIEDLVNGGGTMIDAARKLIGDVLYYAQDLISTLSIDADEFAAISKEWHENSTLGAALRPSMSNATNSGAITGTNPRLWLATAQNTGGFTAQAKAAAAVLGKFVNNPLIDSEARMQACYDFAVADDDNESLVGMIFLSGLDSDKIHASVDEMKRMKKFGVVAEMMDSAALYNRERSGPYGFSNGELNAICTSSWRTDILQ
jgi:hypothetical protein